MTIDTTAATPMTLAIETRSPAETEALAAALAAAARPGDRIALSGPLGAGKTVFAKGFARGLAVRDVVNSPSFTLMAEYEGRLPLFHQDLYRLAGAEEALAGGLLDERQEEGVTLTEWAERLPEQLDPARLTVVITIIAQDARRIGLRPGDDRHAGYVGAAEAWQRERDR